MAEPIRPYNAENPAHVRSRKRQAEREAVQVRDAFGWVMSDKRGRLVMEQIIVGAGFYDNPFTGDNRTDFNCGRQHQAQKLVDFLEQEFPSEFLSMEAERLASKIQAKIRDEAARTEPAEQNLTSEGV